MAMDPGLFRRQRTKVISLSAIPQPVAREAICGSSKQIGKEIHSGIRLLGDLART